MSKHLLVDDLIDQVRSQLDEENLETVSNEDILQVLNRAQDFAANILARHYEDPLLTKTAITLTANQAEYDIPEDAFEDRLEKVEVTVNNFQYEVQRISYRDLSLYESNSSVSIPYYYCVIGRQYRLIPTPTAANDLRIWYLKDPDQLVVNQGRITSINTGSNYVLLDSVGTDLTTETDQLASYVNIVDKQTGLVKSSMQVKTISGNRITFKSTPTRSTVLNRTIASSIDTEIELDDHLCLIQGTCVPFLKSPMTNFLVQYGVAELTRKLGGSADMEERVLEKFEEQIKHQWVGREQQLRVKTRSKHWPTTFRRFFSSES